MLTLLSKRSQAALDFLLSYGWVIFLILIILAILVSFGIFDTSVILPDKIEVGTAVKVKDYTVKEDSVTFVFENIAGKPLYNFSISIDGCNNGAGATSSPIRIGKDGTATVVVPCRTSKTGFSDFKSDLEVHYTERMAGTSQLSVNGSNSGVSGIYSPVIEIGKIIAEVQPGESLSYITLSFDSPTFSTGTTVNYGGYLPIKVAVNESGGSYYLFNNFANSLIGWYRMEEGSGTSFTDGANGFTGSCLTYCPTYVESGAYGGAYSFTSSMTGGAISVAASSGNAPKKNSFTLSLWVKPSYNLANVEDPSMALFYGLNTIANNFTGIGLRGGNFKGIEFIIGNGVVGAENRYIKFIPTESLNSVLSDGGWHHIAVERDCSDDYPLKLYVDAVLVNTTINANTLGDPNICLVNLNSSSYGWYIGRNNYGADGRSFNGSIDEILIFNRSLALDEIQALYDASIYGYDHEFWYPNTGNYTSVVYGVTKLNKQNSTGEIRNEVKCDHYITSCASDDGAGYWIPGHTYCLANSITNGVVDGDGVCLYIKASNVTLGGQGYTLDGIMDSETFGIYAESVNNITVRNIVVQEFGTTTLTEGVGAGVRFVNVHNSTIDNVTTHRIQANSLEYSDHNTVTNLIADNSTVGIGLWYANYNSISNVIIRDGKPNEETEGSHGIHIGYSNYNNFTNIYIDSTKYDGIKVVYESTGNIFSNINISRTSGFSQQLDATGNTFNNIYSHDNHGSGFACLSGSAFGSGNIFEGVYPCEENGWPVEVLNYVDPYDCDYWIYSCETIDYSIDWLPGKYCIGADLTATDRNCLEIAASPGIGENISIFGLGHSIDGDNNVNIGINIMYAKNISIRDLWVHDFLISGIVFAGTNHSTLTNVSSSSNDYMGLSFDSPWIYIDEINNYYLGSYYNNINNCSFFDNGQHGVVGMHNGYNNFSNIYSTGNYYYGYYLIDDTNDVISNSYITGGTSGIWYRGCTGGNINNNYVANSAFGMLIDNSNYVNLTSNTIVNCGYGLDLDDSHYCTVNGLITNYTSIAAYTEGLVISKSNYNNISDVNASRFDIGVDLYHGSSYNRLRNITSQFNNYGLKAYHGFATSNQTNNSIVNSTFNWNQYGIYIINASSTNITNTFVNSNNLGGINISTSTNVNITATQVLSNSTSTVKDIYCSTGSSATGKSNNFGQKITNCANSWPVNGVDYTPG